MTEKTILSSSAAVSLYTSCYVQKCEQAYKEYYSKILLGQIIKLWKFFQEKFFLQIMGLSRSLKLPQNNIDK
jgi:hypothetical protein